MKSFKDILNEVNQPLSQGEQNFKALHGSLEAVNRDMVPGVTDQDHIFKGTPRRADPQTASYEDEGQAMGEYDKTLKVRDSGIGITTESVEDIEEEYKDPDKHYAKQSKKMQDAINLHLRKGKTYWEAVRASKVHVKEGWVALGPAYKPGEKPKSPFNKLGNPNPGTTMYGDRPELKPSGRSDNRKSAAYNKPRLGEEVELDEKTLTPAEMKKREEIVKAIKRGNKGMDKSMAYAIATKTAKRVAENYDMDYEGEMAKAELNAICDKAGVLAEMLDNDTQLEAWLQSKITKAKYMIDSVYDYLMYSQPNVDPEPENQSATMASNYGSFLNRMGEEVELHERVMASDYKVGAEKSQFGGYLPYVKHKTKGHTMYRGGTAYKSAEHAMGHAHAYLKGYAEAGDTRANRAASQYAEKNKEHLYKKDSSVNESKEGYNTWYNRGKSYRERTKAAHNFSMANVNAMIRDEKERKERERKEAEKKKTNEEVEQIDEISQEKKDKYVMRASGEHRMANAARRSEEPGSKAHDFWKRKEMNRKKGISRAIGEELELDEARRGRPRKDGSKPEGDEEGGREHIVMQLRKVVNLRGQKPVEFNDNSKHDISVDHAKKALAKHDSMHKASDKQAYAERLAKSHSSFKSAVNEAVDPTTMKSDRGDVKPFVRQDATGKFVVGKRREARKELSVDAKMNEELKGNQHKIDANKNGKIDAHDFKLLKGKKKVEEELKGSQHKIDANKNGKIDAHDFKLLKNKKKMEESLKANMAQDSVNKLKKDPLASKEKIVLPPTQGNKPVGGEDQVHVGKISVAEENILNSLYESLSDENKLVFEKKIQTEEGLAQLLAFAQEHGFNG